MKESKFILFSFFIFSILFIVVISIIQKLYPTAIDYFGIECNILCGIIVGIITSLCQYYSARKRVINTIYSLYFDIYRTYYYSNNRPVLKHYNSYSIYKKIIDLSPKINEVLEEYEGLLIKKDKMYKKINPNTDLLDKITSKKLNKTLLWFNKKDYDYIFNPIITEIENILNNINQVRFRNDKDQMEYLYNKLWR